MAVLWFFYSQLIHSFNCDRFDFFEKIFVDSSLDDQ